MTDRNWNEHYANDNLPWDSGYPDASLITAVETGAIPLGRALEIGCGTGTNALWLANRGFDVLGIDIAPLAIERARARASSRACRFEVHDILQMPIEQKFNFVFDRGCFHVFDSLESRILFVQRVAQALAPNGRWLSLIGSTEGAPRQFGPPRRSLRDLAQSIEPYLEIIEVRAINFDPIPEAPEAAPQAWACLSRIRTMQAQPSTGAS